MFSKKKFTDIYKLTPNVAKARDNGDFSIFENFYNEKTLKAAEKMFHTHIYSCVQHCICRLQADNVHYNMSDLLEECIALMEKEKEMWKLWENKKENKKRYKKIQDEKEYPDKFSIERGDWDNFNFDEWFKTATTKTRLTSTPSSFDIGDEDIICTKAV